jgi:hypothetical protein
MATGAPFETLQRTDPCGCSARPERKGAPEDSLPRMKQEGIEQGWNVAEQPVVDPRSDRLVGLPREEVEKHVPLSEHVPVQKSVTKQIRENGRGYSTEDCGLLCGVAGKIVDVRTVHLRLWHFI